MSVGTHSPTGMSGSGCPLMMGMCGSEDDATMGWNDLIGRQLEHYQILDELGRGGSSRVYRARDTREKRDVAIKVIPNETDDRATFVRRFEREVQTVQKLHHPNIVAVFGAGETDDLVYLVLQCVMGGTLRQRMGMPLPTGVATSYIIQMARALHHAHVQGIVHRDVKPSNMLVDADDARHVLLTDFGIAKIQGALGLTKSGTTIGTPEYMSPEQAEGREIDQRADIYALGCVLYEALTGRPPFVGSTPVSVLYQQVHSRPAYIRGFNPEVPRELARILEIALAKRPEDRFGTAELLAEALTPFADGTLPAPEVTESPQMPQMWSARNGTSPFLFSHLPRLENGVDGAAAPMENGFPLLPQKGMGSEGLDAIFLPDTQQLPPPEMVNRLAPPPPATPPPAQPLVQRGPKQTIPLPAFRLPARKTQPLDMPLTADGELDIEALMTHLDEARASLEQQRATPSQPQAPAAATWQPPQPNGAPPRRGATPGRPGVISGGPPRMEGGRPTGTPNLPPLAPQGPGARQPLFPTPPRRAATSRPVQQTWNAPRRRRALPTGVAVTAVLALALVGWLTLSATGLGVTLLAGRAPQATRTARPAATATTQPTATTAAATPAPTTTTEPTATTNPQAQLDAQAAGTFRAVTVGTYQDGSCTPANGTSHFNSGQTIYVNLCTSGDTSAGPMRIDLRQNGSVLYTLVYGKYLSPGSSYFYLTYHGFAPGNYDMLVSITVNGTQSTARDIPLTIG